MFREIALTADDVQAIHFVGGRYGWSAETARQIVEEDDGKFYLRLEEESDMRAWVDEVDSDTEGGHSYFPMLDPGSELYDKLAELRRNYD